MHIKQVVIAISILAAAGGAMAVEATQWNPPAGQLTRGEVKAELARATANGELEARGEAYAGFYDAHTPASALTRAEVKQELARARASGELEANRGELYGSFPEPHARDGGHVFAWRKSHPTGNNVN